MNYADIRPIDVANGPGVRVSVFVSGCTHRCPECFNPQAWDFAYGQPFTQTQIEEILDHLSKPYIRGLTILGGEPFEGRNQQAVLSLAGWVRQSAAKKDVWCYTGYLYEQLATGQVGQFSRQLLEQLDVLVDGPFIAAEKDLSLRFRGSANQRILDVPASLKAGEARLWDDLV